MPKPALNIGVLTLCRGDEVELEPGPLGEQVKILISNGTLSYAPVPDDWIPFNDGTTILHHLEVGFGFELGSTSARLNDFEARRETKLFVIDPVVLFHPAKADLAVLIQEHVCSRNNQASCIVFRGTLPKPFIDELSNYYIDKFSTLLNCANSSLFEYQVNDLFRLKQFLRRVTPLLGTIPDDIGISQAVRALATMPLAYAAEAARMFRREYDSVFPNG